MKRCAWNNGVQNVAGLIQRNADGSNMPSAFCRVILLLWPTLRLGAEVTSTSPKPKDDASRNRFWNQCPSSPSSLRLGNWKTNMLRELFEPGPGRQPVILALPWWQKVVDVDSPKAFGRGHYGCWTRCTCESECTCSRSETWTSKYAWNDRVAGVLSFSSLLCHFFLPLFFCFLVCFLLLRLQASGWLASPNLDHLYLEITDISLTKFGALAPPPHLYTFYWLHIKWDLHTVMRCFYACAGFAHDIQFGIPLWCVVQAFQQIKSTSYIFI